MATYNPGWSTDVDASGQAYYGSNEAFAGHPIADIDPTTGRQTPGQGNFAWIQQGQQANADAQNQALKNAQDLYAGKGPSLATQLLQQQAGRSMANQNAMASSAQGSQSALARRQAMMANAGTMQDLGSQAATARAQEQLGAEHLQGQLAGQARAQDLSRLGMQGGMLQNQSGNLLQAYGLSKGVQLAQNQQNIQLGQMGAAAAGAMLMAAADLHLKEPGPDGQQVPEENGGSHWIIREEPDFLLAVNARNGQLRKLMTAPLSPEEHKQATSRHGAGPIGSPNPANMTVNDLKPGMAGAGMQSPPMSDYAVDDAALNSAMARSVYGDVTSGVGDTAAPVPGYVAPNMQPDFNVTNVTGGVTSDSDARLNYGPPSTLPKNTSQAPAPQSYSPWQNRAGAPAPDAGNKKLSRLGTDFQNTGKSNESGLVNSIVAGLVANRRSVNQGSKPTPPDSPDIVAGDLNMKGSDAGAGYRQQLSDARAGDKVAIGGNTTPMVAGDVDLGGQTPMTGADKLLAAMKADPYSGSWSAMAAPTEGPQGALKPAIVNATIAANASRTPTASGPNAPVGRFSGLPVDMGTADMAVSPDKESPEPASRESSWSDRDVDRGILDPKKGPANLFRGKAAIDTRMLPKDEQGNPIFEVAPDTITAPATTSAPPQRGQAADLHLGGGKLGMGKVPGIPTMKGLSPFTGGSGANFGVPKMKVRAPSAMSKAYGSRKAA